MKNRYLFALLLTLGTCVFAQPASDVAYFMKNQLMYNPAAAGMHKTQFNANLLTRLEWGTSFNGAPTNFTLWSDYRFEGKNMATGLVLTDYSFGGYNNVDLNLNYAYYLRLNRKLKLAMGLRAGFSTLSFSTANFVIENPDDPLATSSNFNSFLPKFGYGMQLNSFKSYVGVSLPDLITIDSDKVLGDSASFLQKERNYMFSAGTVFSLGDRYAIRPNVFTIYHPDTKLIVKLNSIFEIKDYFWAGLTYSTSNAFAILAGTHISSRVKLGYAFEVLSGKFTNNLFTHEINITANLDNLFRKRD